jgi:hypothetical protein
MKQKIIVAVPSYGRAVSCREKTVSTLMRGGIMPEEITVFVVDDEYYEYLAEMPAGVRLVIGRLGVVAQRMFITEYFDEGAQVVSCDDDIEEIDLAGIYVDLREFFTDAFTVGKFWGVNPVWNAYFREKAKWLSYDLRLICGVMYGFVNSRDIKQHCKLANKEDYERTFLYYERDGKVVRFNQIGVKTKYYGRGGIGIFSRRIEAARVECEWLLENYPRYVSGIWRRKNGMWELKLNKI